MKLSNLLLTINLIIYIYNYLIGILLKFKIIKISKLHHKIIFSALIFAVAVNFIFSLFLLNLKFINVLLLFISILTLLILPIGKKGSLYHIIVSSISILSFTIYFTMQIQ
jgi:hypothetical protein